MGRKWIPCTNEELDQEGYFFIELLSERLPKYFETVTGLEDWEWEDVFNAFATNELNQEQSDQFEKLRGQHPKIEEHRSLFESRMKFFEVLRDYWGKDALKRDEELTQTPFPEATYYVGTSEYYHTRMLVERELLRASNAELVNFLRRSSEVLTQIELRSLVRLMEDPDDFRSTYRLCQFGHKISPETFDPQLPPETDI